MGNLGFLFNLEKEDIVIFVKRENFKGDIIVGTKSFKKKNTKYKFLSKDLKLDNFLLLKTSKLKSAKIRLSEKKAIDYEFLTFWFGTNSYKKLRQLFETKQITNEEDLINKVIEIYKYF